MIRRLRLSRLFQILLNIFKYSNPIVALKFNLVTETPEQIVDESGNELAVVILV
jgi:hypothetical protein